MPKLQLSNRVYTILDIKRLFENKELRIQPKYQRRRTEWPRTAKTALIDSIANNFPVPPIYLRDYVDTNHKRTKEIVDGQQRIATIIEFLSDKFALYKNFSISDYIGYTFSELPNQMRQQIEDFELAFIAIKGAYESDIISMFSRINSFSLPLNAQEKRNALFTGELKTLIYELSSEYYRFWTDNRILSDKAIARMQDAQLVSELITTIILGYKKYSRSKIDGLYEKYDDSFRDKAKFDSEFNIIMSYIGTLFENEEIALLFRGRALFFTLFLVLYEKLFGVLGKSRYKKRKTLKLNVITVPLKEFAIRYRRKNFNKKIKLLFQQGTASAQNRERRHKVIAGLLR